MDELFSFYLTTRFAIYAASVTGSIFASLFGIRWMELRLRYAARLAPRTRGARPDPRHRARRHGPRSAKYQSVAKLHRFSYAAVSGIIGAQSVLFAKSTVELIADSISGGGLLLAYPATYAVIFAMAACVILQVRHQLCPPNRPGPHAPMCWSRSTGSTAASPAGMPSSTCPSSSPSG